MRCVDWIILSCSRESVHVPEAYVSVGVMTILNKRDDCDTEMRKVEEEMTGVDGQARAGGKEYGNERAVLLFDRKRACQE